MVEYKHITGFPNQVFGSLNLTIGQYKRNHYDLKVGITGQDPQNRFNQHRKEFPWKRMVTIYESVSEKHCNILEQFLVECHFNDLRNKKPGGGSKLSVPVRITYMYF
jgi:hypothetical protein